MKGFIVFFEKEECFIHEVNDANIDIDTHIDLIGAKSKPNRGYKLDIKLKGNLVNPDESPTLIMTSLTKVLTCSSELFRMMNTFSPTLSVEYML